MISSTRPPLALTNGSLPLVEHDRQAAGARSGMLADPAVVQDRDLLAGCHAGMERGRLARPVGHHVLAGTPLPPGRRARQGSAARSAGRWCWRSHGPARRRCPGPGVGDAAFRASISASLSGALKNSGRNIAWPMRLTWRGGTWSRTLIRADRLNRVSPRAVSGSCSAMAVTSRPANTLLGEG